MPFYIFFWCYFHPCYSINNKIGLRLLTTSNCRATEEGFEPSDHLLRWSTPQRGAAINQTLPFRHIATREGLEPTKRSSRSTVFRTASSSCQIHAIFQCGRRDLNPHIIKDLGFSYYSMSPQPYKKVYNLHGFEPRLHYLNSFSSQTIVRSTI